MKKVTPYEDYSLNARQDIKEGQQQQHTNQTVRLMFNCKNSIGRIWGGLLIRSNMRARGWRAGSAVKSPYRGLSFDPQHHSSRWSVTPVSGDLMPSSGLQGHQHAHAVSPCPGFSRWDGLRSFRWAYSAGWDLNIITPAGNTPGQGVSSASSLSYDFYYSLPNFLQPFLPGLTLLLCEFLPEGFQGAWGRQGLFFKLWTVCGRHLSAAVSQSTLLMRATY